MKTMLKSAVFAASAVFGLAQLAHAAPELKPASGFFEWSTVSNPTTTDYTPAPFLHDNPASIAAARATLTQQQNAGATLAIKVLAPLQSAAARQIFNDFKVQYVFCDFESVDAVGRTRAVADLVVGSTKSSNAYVGNFGFSPNAGNDPTRPGNASLTSAASFQNSPQNFSYTDSRGKVVVSNVQRNGNNMSNEALYPGAPDYKNPAQGNSSAPNIRSALFTLPIIRESLAQKGLPTGDAHVPWVTRFNNWGNSALDTDGNSSNGYQFVQNAANPANGQLLSRGDFQAQILHYRLRGANSVNLFEDSVSSVVGYSKAQSRGDVSTGWSNSSAINSIIGRHNYAFANLNTFIGDSGTASGNSNSGTSIETSGAVWSGVYDKSGSGRRMALLLSNLSPVSKTIDLPNDFSKDSTHPNGFYTTNDNNSIAVQFRDDYTLPAGTHRLLTFTLLNNVWHLDGDSYRFTDNNRNGIGIPEPTTLSLLGLGAMGLLARRRRKA